ncbi:hypothetical protein BDZ91DRAFT_172234 [Kalaharituber pfeilii]|nr:hypothetical protein BDZ91DRAFT_172234 [Kalaharituber pfeilii]
MLLLSLCYLACSIIYHCLVVTPSCSPAHRVLAIGIHTLRARTICINAASHFAPYIHAYIHTTHTAKVAHVITKQPHFGSRVLYTRVGVGVPVALPDLGRNP